VKSLMVLQGKKVEMLANFIVNGLAVSDMSKLPQDLLAVAAFGVLGIILTVLGFKLFDWAMPHINVEKELAERNYAVAIVMAASILAVALVIVAATMG
jgi:uncharacterized membrane protein YjfL (UPF0719 family)